MKIEYGVMESVKTLDTNKVNMQFLDPKDIINGELDFIDYSKIDWENAEITRTDLWYVSSFDSIINRNLFSIQLDTQGTLEFNVAGYDKIKDRFKSKYDNLVVTQYNSVRIPIAEFKLIDCELVTECIEKGLTKLTYKFESFEFKELTKDED